jgi:hypothetical protein
MFDGRIPLHHEDMSFGGPTSPSTSSIVFSLCQNVIAQNIGWEKLDPIHGMAIMLESLPTVTSNKPSLAFVKEKSDTRGGPG